MQDSLLRSLDADRTLQFLRTYFMSIPEWHLPKFGLNCVILLSKTSSLCLGAWPKPHCCAWLGTGEPGGMEQHIAFL